MKSLDHKNILKIEDVILYEKTMYLFMDFMDGGSLTDIIVAKNWKEIGFNENVIAYILKEIG